MTADGPSPSLTEILRLLVAALDRHAIRYSLIGGLAVGLRSRARYTEDVDLLLEIPQLKLPRLLQDLQAGGFEFDMHRTISAWVQTHMAQLQYQGIAVDWLKPVLPCFAHVIDRATPENWSGTLVRVAQAENLIVLKLLAMRTLDVADIESLLAANPGRLDLDLIRGELQATLPGDPVLQRFEELAAEFYRPTETPDHE